MEPEIKDLQNFLNKMGAKVQGAGTNVIKITGVKKLKDISYNIMPDRIEAGTFLCAAGITQGKLQLNNIVSEHIGPIINKLEECGCKFKIEKNSVVIDSSRMDNHEIPENLMRQMRSSVVLAGAILARFKNVVFTYPRGM